MYNRNQFKKVNDKKVLHKIKRYWVTISIAMLGLIGGEAIDTTNASANTINQSNNDHQANYSLNINNIHNNQLKLSNNKHMGNKNNTYNDKYITKSANILHNRIINHSLLFNDLNYNLYSPHNTNTQNNGDNYSYSYYSKNLDNRNNTKYKLNEINSISKTRIRRNLGYSVPHTGAYQKAYDLISYAKEHDPNISNISAVYNDLANAKRCLDSLNATNLKQPYASDCTSMLSNLGGDLISMSNNISEIYSNDPMRHALSDANMAITELNSEESCDNQLYNFNVTGPEVIYNFGESLEYSSLATSYENIASEIETDSDDNESDSNLLSLASAFDSGVYSYADSVISSNSQSLSQSTSNSIRNSINDISKSTSNIVSNTNALLNRDKFLLNSDSSLSALCTSYMDIISSDDKHITSDIIKGRLSSSNVYNIEYIANNMNSLASNIDVNMSNEYSSYNNARSVFSSAYFSTSKFISSVNSAETDLSCKTNSLDVLVKNNPFDKDTSEATSINWCNNNDQVLSNSDILEENTFYNFTGSTANPSWFSFINYLRSTLSHNLSNATSNYHTVLNLYNSLGDINSQNSLSLYPYEVSQSDIINDEKKDFNYEMFIFKNMNRLYQNEKNNLQHINALTNNSLYSKFITISNRLSKDINDFNYTENKMHDIDNRYSPSTITSTVHKFSPEDSSYLDKLSDYSDYYSSDKALIKNDYGEIKAILGSSQDISNSSVASIVSSYSDRNNSLIRYVHSQGSQYISNLRLPYEAFYYNQMAISNNSNNVGLINPTQQNFSNESLAESSAINYEYMANSLLNEKDIVQKSNINNILSSKINNEINQIYSNTNAINSLTMPYIKFSNAKSSNIITNSSDNITNEIRADYEREFSDGTRDFNDLNQDIKVYDAVCADYNNMTINSDFIPSDLNSLSTQNSSLINDEHSVEQDYTNNSNAINSLMAKLKSSSSSTNHDLMTAKPKLLGATASTSFNSNNTLASSSISTSNNLSSSALSNTLLSNSIQNSTSISKHGSLFSAPNTDRSNSNVLNSFNRSVTNSVINNDTQSNINTEVISQNNHESLPSWIDSTRSDSFVSSSSTNYNSSNSSNNNSIHFGSNQASNMVSSHLDNKTSNKLNKLSTKQKALSTFNSDENNDKELNTDNNLPLNIQHIDSKVTHNTDSDR